MPSSTEEKLEPQAAASTAPKTTPRDRETGSYAMMEEEVRRVYFKFYAESYKSKPDGLDRKTKELIAISAALALGCKNCLEGHIKKAIEFGATRRELAETLALAVGVGAASIVDRSDIAAANVGLESLLAKAEAENDNTEE